jgi:replicative DNA helicase
MKMGMDETKKQQSERSNRETHKAVSIQISTEFSTLDFLKGGFSGGEVVVLGGRPSSGKTALVIHISLHAALEKGIPVLLFSLEMSKEMISQRMLSSLTGIRTKDLQAGSLSPEDWPRLTSAAKALSEAPIYIMDSGETSASEIASMGRSLNTQCGIGLIIVDYIQLLHGGFSDGENNLIEETMERLNALAKELQIPFLILSQIRRPNSDGRDAKPSISRLNWRGNIEFYADKVIFIHSEDNGFEKETENGKGTEDVEVIVAKNRNGSVGTVKLAFRKSCGRFEET